MINSKIDIMNETPEGLLQKSLQSLSESSKYKEVIAREKEEISKIREEVNEMKEFPAGYIPSESDVAKLQAWNDAMKQLVRGIKNKCECQLKMAENKCKMSQNYLDLAINIEQISPCTDSVNAGNIPEKYLPISLAIFTRHQEIREARKSIGADLCLDNQREDTTGNGWIEAEHVYFLLSKNNKTVKIGYSSQLSSRIKTLQTGSPEKLTLLKAIPGSKQLEARLHKKFAANRLHGEWFSATTEIMEYIKSL